jgi:SSS family solute:Na+ symporter
MAALPASALAAGAEASPPRGFGIADWLVLVVYTAALMGIGYYYSRRQTTTEEYFVGSRRLSPMLVGISLFATLYSTLSYFGSPGEIVQNGPVIIAVNLATVPLVYLIVGYVIIPIIMRMKVTSAYELLEARLGRRVRLLGSGMFIITRVLWMALMLYTTSFVIVTVMGWDPRWVTIISILTGGVTTAYTLSGGIEGVVVTDVLQFFVLLLGAAATAGWITYQMGGVGEWWPTAWAPHWAPQPFFSADPHVRVTMVGTFFGNIILWICITSSDQLAIQRYQTMPDVAAARRSFWHKSVVGALVSVTLGLVGLALLGFYQKNPQVLPAHLTVARNGDAIFPHYISHFLPAGLSGLMIAGVLSAAMSSLSSGINSTVTVLSKDFADTLWPKTQRTDATRLKAAHWMAAGLGTITILGSSVVGAVPGNLMEVGNKTLNLFFCPIFGLFFLAFCVPFATPFGAVIGLIYSVAAAALVGYWDLIIGGARLSFQWISPVALLTTVVSSTLFSLLPTRGKPFRVLAAYATVVLLPWPALIVLLRH